MGMTTQARPPNRGHLHPPSVHDPFTDTHLTCSELSNTQIKDVAAENKGGFHGELKEPYKQPRRTAFFFELQGRRDFPAIQRLWTTRGRMWTVELDRTGTRPRKLHHRQEISGEAGLTV